VSSLGLSLLLLVVLAVGVALLYNLRQAWPRLRRPGAVRAWRRELPGVGARAARGDAAAASRRPPPPTAHAGQDEVAAAPRGEPRLGADPIADEVEAPDAPGASRTAPWAADPSIPTLHPESAPAAQSAAISIASPAAAAAVPAAAPVDSARPAFASASIEPALAPSPPVRPAPAAAVAQPRLSEICDCIVEMPLPAPCAGERLVAIAQRFRRAGSKPVIIEGQPVDDAPGDWAAPAAARQYAALRVGILMANRHGPLNAMEFSEFVTGVQAIAESLAALADTPDMSTVLARARDLDATCAQLDAQIGLNVEAPEAISPAQLAALGSVLAVAERGSNRYARLGPQGEPVFSVALADVPNRFTFLLDVPRSSSDPDPWGQMLEAARACARQVGGQLVDDGGRPLADAALAQIGRQLVQRYESLEAIGLPAGSALALRVFN